MPENQTIHKYQSRMDRVINYIYAHLDDEIDLNHLAEVACMSPYHWHRIYRGFSGETIAATVRRLRLHRGANQLINTNLSLSEIVAQSGYGSLSAFSRAFSASYQVPPARYRENGNAASLVAKTIEGNAEMYDVTIVETDTMIMVGLFHEGPYAQIGKAFEKLNIFAKKMGMENPNTKTMALYYDDPDILPAGELNSFAGLVEQNPSDPDEPFERIEVKGGRFAVMRFKGAYAALPKAYDWLYGSWLVQSGQNLRDAPCLEAYLNNPREVSPSDLLTDIYMPIE